MSRHRTANNRPWKAIAIVTGAVLVGGGVAGVAGFAAINNTPEKTVGSAAPSTSVPAAGDPESCEDGPTTLRVAVATGFTDVLKGVGGGPCVNLEITKGDGFDGAVALKKGEADVWIPDSRERAAVVNADYASSAESLAISPIVMSASKSTAEALGKSGQSFSWAMLAAGDAAGMPKLQTQDWKTTSVMINVTDVVNEAAAVRVKDKYRAYAAVASAVAQLEKSGAADTSKAVPEGTIRVAEERLVGKDVVLPLAEGVPSLDYSWVMPASDDEAVSRAGAALLSRLHGEEGKAALAEHGFLEPGTTSFTTVGGAQQKLAERPAQEDLRLLFTMADSSVLSARVLALVDLSGSMGTIPAGATISGMDGLKQAMTLFASTMPDNVVVGGWGFGYQIAPPKDYQVLIEPDTLAKTRMPILGLAQTLQPQPTGTALYSTFLDAYKDTQKNFDADDMNVLAVFTDGRNQDAPDALEMDQLLSQLKKVADPKKPISTLFFGFGDADVASMKKITGVVGGNVWKIDYPEQIVGAMIEATATTGRIGIPKGALD